MKALPLPRRWLAFNGVGLLGFGVQIATLALLVHGFGVHYLPATLVAVEAAVLHNFFWHRRWTWADRPGAGTADALRQLGRFHLLNGLVSLTGNSVMMLTLTGALGWNPVAANTLTVLGCAVFNFLASDRLVFRNAAIAALTFVVASSVGPLRAAETAVPGPGAATLQAWDEYRKRLDARVASAGAGFFAHDEFRREGGWRQAAFAGSVPMFRASAAGPDLPEPDVPDGRIHHWIGAIHVPGATLDEVLRHLKEHAGREADVYEDVVASKLLSRDGDRLRVFMKLRRESIITVTYNTEHEVEYRRTQERRATSRSVATRIAELADAGGPREREKPEGQDHGFLWRLNAYWRYEEVSDGVLIECESVSLSRSVPLLLRPFVNRTVDRIARESLEKTLRTLRATLVASGL